MPIDYGTNDVSASGLFTAVSGNFTSSLQVASGIVISNAIPSSTTNTLYNDNGTLKFNGSVVNKSYASILMFG